MRLNQFDLRLLQIFTVIVDCGGFSAAQVRLGMSQSTISGKMSDLETRLGVRLCQRGRSGFRLTERKADHGCAQQAGNKQFLHVISP